MWWIIAAALVLALAAGALALLYRVYKWVYRRDPAREADPRKVPEGEAYANHRASIIANVERLIAAPFEEVRLTAPDGAELYGRYYELAPGAPVMINFHGYRSNALRDANAVFKLCTARGMNALIPDQRAHGRSGGRALTFGVLERQDCLEWARWAAERSSAPIVLAGISMGAATALMAADLELPGSVCGIIADCGYTSPREIITKVSADMGMPPRFAYAVARLAAMVYAGFDPNAASAGDALRKCSIPVLFIHGEADDYVPCEMSRRNFLACAAEKRLLTIPGAPHGMSYYTDMPAYDAAVEEFLEKVL